MARKTPKRSTLTFNGGVLYLVPTLSVVERLQCYWKNNGIQ